MHGDPASTTSTFRSSPSSESETMSNSRRSNTADDILLGQKPELGIVIRSKHDNETHSFNPYASRKSFKRFETISPPSAIGGSSSNEQPKYGIIYVYLCTAVACLSSVLLGYDIGVMSGAIVYLERDLHFNILQSEIVVSSLNLTSTIGALGGGHLASKLGRRLTVIISSVLFLIGALLMAFTSSFYIILLCRILLGLAAGTGLFIAPLYSAELSPANLRGKLVTFCEISINIGILLGYLSSWLFRNMPDDLAWRWMVGVGSVPSIILFIGMIFMPESPRWLVEHSYEYKARLVLLKILSPLEVEIQIDEIKKSLEIEYTQMRNSNNNSNNWKQLICCCFYKNQSKMIKHALIIGIGVSFFQQATGNEAAVYWTPKIFEQVGLDNNWVFLATVFVGVAKVAGIFVATFLLDKVGRRPLLLASAILMTFSLLGLGIAFSIGKPIIFTISMQCLFCASFSIGWGPITWVVVSEIFPLTIRSRAMSICTLVNRLMSGTVALTFLSLQKLITAEGAWYLFTGISVISVIFVFFLIPETKGKTLEQITQFLVSLNFRDITSSSSSSSLGSNRSKRNKNENENDKSSLENMIKNDYAKKKNSKSIKNNKMEMIPNFDENELMDNENKSRDENDETKRKHNETKMKSHSLSSSPIEPISKDSNSGHTRGYGSTNEIENEKSIGSDTRENRKSKKKRKKKKRKLNEDYQSDSASMPDGI